MTDDAVRGAAKRYSIPYADLMARMEIVPDGDIETMARLVSWQYAQISARAGELAYLMQYEGDIFANAERYRTIRDSIVARAN